LSLFCFGRRGLIGLLALGGRERGKKKKRKKKNRHLPASRFLCLIVLGNIYLHLPARVRGGKKKRKKGRSASKDVHYPETQGRALHDHFHVVTFIGERQGEGGGEKEKKKKGKLAAMTVS